MNISKFVEMLAAHDWLYAYSDDHRYWLRGTAQEKEINAALKEHPEWMNIYRLYGDYMTGEKKMARSDFAAEVSKALKELQ